MDGESINSADAGNAALTVEEGASALAALLANRKPSQANPPREEAAADDTEADDELVLNDEVDAETEAEETDEPEPEETTYKLPDGTVVTLQELQEWRQGHLRQADYTRKTQELAEQRKATEQRQAEAAEKAQRFSTQLDLAIQVTSAYIPDAPDPSLMQTDPIGYIQAKEFREAKIAELNTLLTAKQQHEAEQAQAKQQEFQKWVDGEKVALLETLPELKDPAKAKAFTDDLIKYLPAFGYTQDDLKEVYDHRLVKVIKFAVAYQKLMERKPVAVDKTKNAPPVQPAGRRGSPTDAAAASKRTAFDNLRKTGSLQDGAAAILQIMKGK